MQFESRWVPTNSLVHDWLGDSRLIAFIVTSPAVTDDIYDHIFFKLHTVIHCQLRDKNNGLWVIAIHMKDWRLNHFRHFSAIVGRPRVGRVTDCITDLVIDDDVDRSTRVKATNL